MNWEENLIGQMVLTKAMPIVVNNKRTIQKVRFGYYFRSESEKEIHKNYTRLPVF